MGSFRLSEDEHIEKLDARGDKGNQETGRYDNLQKDSRDRYENPCFYLMIKQGLFIKGKLTRSIMITLLPFHFNRNIMAFKLMFI